MINMSFGTLELNFGEQLKEGNSLKTSQVVNSTKLAELISDKAKIGQKSTKKVICTVNSLTILSIIECSRQHERPDHPSGCRA